MKSRLTLRGELSERGICLLASWLSFLSLFSSVAFKIMWLCFFLISLYVLLVSPLSPVLSVSVIHPSPSSLFCSSLPIMTIKIAHSRFLRPQLHLFVSLYKGEGHVFLMAEYDNTVPYNNFFFFFFTFKMLKRLFLEYQLSPGLLHFKKHSGNMILDNCWLLRSTNITAY